MRLVLLADLHFGRDRPELQQPLLEAIRAAAPDMVAIAGDFVQRARRSMYREARDFLAALPCDWVAVPGNHDVPLYNLPGRLIQPHAAYRRWIAQDLEPVVELDEAVILGLDTTDPFAQQRGRVDREQIERICAVIDRERGRRIVLILAHHPFHHRPEVEKKLMRGAPKALERWASCGPHAILTGHLHQWVVEPFVTRKGDRQTLQLHCGTGLSDRLRGDPNDFAVIDINGAVIRIARMASAPGETLFAEAGTSAYRATDEGWLSEPLPAIEADGIFKQTVSM